MLWWAIRSPSRNPSRPSRNLLLPNRWRRASPRRPPIHKRANLLYVTGTSRGLPIFAAGLGGSAARRAVSAGLRTAAPALLLAVRFAASGDDLLCGGATQSHHRSAD